MIEIRVKTEELKKTHTRALVRVSETNHKIKNIFQFPLQIVAQTQIHVHTQARTLATPDNQAKVNIDTHMHTIAHRKRTQGFDLILKFRLRVSKQNKRGALSDRGGRPREA